MSKAVMREAIAIQRDEPAMNRAGQILMYQVKKATVKLLKFAELPRN